MQRTFHRPARTALVAVTALLATSLLCAPAFGRGCDHKADREARIDAAGASVIRIEARAGDLSVRGVEGTVALAQGIACADDRDDLDGIQIVTSREGDTMKIEAEIPENRGWNDAAWLDLEIDVPNGIDVVIDDSSGDITVREARVRRIDDSSGDISVRDNRGDLEIDDSSGDVGVRQQNGDLVISDSSGDLRLVGIDGTVTIDQDSSGDIVVDRVTGSVIVERDSSGDIRVADVGGDFEVHRDGSGDIDYSDVRGRVDVPADD